MFTSLTKFFYKLAIGKIQTHPCLPGPFGYETAWYAIKGETPKSVIEKLKLDVACEANWESGIGYVYNFSDGEVFVSPEVDGYVLVIGLPGDNELARKHGVLFDELQYFGNHRVTDYYAWVRFANGELIRAYSICRSTGEFWNKGNITDEELELGLDKFPVEEISGDSCEEHKIADEEFVLRIAKAWGVDPLFAEGEYEQASGHICRFR